MLRVRNITTYYGRIQILKGISIHVGEGEIVALIGANGAGKTTLIHTISGLLKVQSGTIKLGDKEIQNRPPEWIVRRGISQVPEGRLVFAPLSVEDNLKLGAYVRYRAGKKDEISRSLEEAFALFPPLEERRSQQAGTLSGGEQQMLAVARALMAQPKLLLLDEPSLGLAPIVSAEIFRVILRLRESGVTILLVEQNAHAALAVADRAYVLETGTVVLQDSADRLLQNREVQRAYLGKGKKEIWDAD
ncbi:MAG TPA: ABC transporter ATP-binding protein [Proteobacteria bacterium]|nr:high-affinity branched-chain amino acid transport ATP-binding protein LivF [bacterium BMS3Abin14]HDL52486.1 ABC transporter ATP-binding protein [Pseudomonadota bacterium]